MAKATYFELLKHPNWQQKRLRILDRDGFKCTTPDCQSTEEMLHVHHLDYKTGAKPWEYEDDWLITLCHSCHKKISADRPWFEKELIKAFRLKAKHHFDQSLAVQLFERYENLSSLLLFLYLLDEKEVLPLLHRHFCGAVPEEYLKPMENIKSNA